MNTNEILMAVVDAINTENDDLYYVLGLAAKRLRMPPSLVTRTVMTNRYEIINMWILSIADRLSATEFNDPDFKRIKSIPPLFRVALTQPEHAEEARIKIDGLRAIFYRRDQTNKSYGLHWLFGSMFELISSPPPTDSTIAAKVIGITRYMADSGMIPTLRDRRFQSLLTTLYEPRGVENEIR